MQHEVDFPEWFGKTKYKSKRPRGPNGIKGTPPWGYEANYKTGMLDPIEKDLDMLRWAFLLLHTGASFESVCEWLTKISDKKVSLPTLRKLVSNERTRRRKKENLQRRIAQGKTKGTSPQEINVLEDYTNYPTDDEDALSDFGVVAARTFRLAKRHASLVSKRIKLESLTRSHDNKLFLSWLKRSERVRRNKRRSTFFRGHGIKLDRLANDNYRTR